MKGEKSCVGARNGLWEVMEIVPGGRRPKRRCRCACGFERTMCADTFAMSKSCRKCGGFLLAQGRYMNKRFGKLVVTEILHEKKGAKRYCNAVCDCGETRKVLIGYLTNGSAKHCLGCKQWSAIARRRNHRVTHGLSGSPEYAAWVSMNHRCRSKKSKAWKTHGGRGITVCERWNPDKIGSENAIFNFIDDMGKRPAGMTLERIDVDGNYTPENCTWASPRHQANNRRNTVFLTIGEETMTLANWARHVGGASGSLIRHRLCAGWPAKEAVGMVGKSGSKAMRFLCLWRGKRNINEHPSVSRVVK